MSDLVLVLVLAQVLVQVLDCQLVQWWVHQRVTMLALMLVGNKFDLGIFYLGGLALAACLFAYQQRLIRFRRREDCFKAFLNNNYAGLVIFAGLVLDYRFGGLG